jgi:hypothetical protein
VQVHVQVQVQVHVHVGLTAGVVPWMTALCL